MALYGGLNSTKPGHNFNEGEERAEHDTSVLSMLFYTGSAKVVIKRK